MENENEDEDITVLRAELNLAGIPLIGMSAASFTVMAGFREGLQHMVKDYICKPSDFRWKQLGFLGVAEFRGPRSMAFTAQNKLRHRAARKLLGKLSSLGAKYIIKDVGKFSLKPKKG